MNTRLLKNVTHFIFSIINVLESYYIIYVVSYQSYYHFESVRVNFLVGHFESLNPNFCLERSDYFSSIEYRQCI